MSDTTSSDSEVGFHFDKSKRTGAPTQAEKLAKVKACFDSEDDLYSSDDENLSKTPPPVSAIIGKKFAKRSVFNLYVGHPPPLSFTYKTDGIHQ